MSKNYQDSNKEVKDNLNRLQQQTTKAKSKKGEQRFWMEFGKPWGKYIRNGNKEKNINLWKENELVMQVVGMES